MVWAVQSSWLTTFAVALRSRPKKVRGLSSRLVISSATQSDTIATRDSVNSLKSTSLICDNPTSTNPSSSKRCPNESKIWTGEATKMWFSWTQPTIRVNTYRSTSRLTVRWSLTAPAFLTKKWKPFTPRPSCLCRASETTLCASSYSISISRIHSMSMFTTCGTLNQSSAPIRGSNNLQSTNKMNSVGFDLKRSRERCKLKHKMLLIKTIMMRSRYKLSILYSHKCNKSSLPILMAADLPKISVLERNKQRIIVQMISLIIKS